MGMKGLRGVGLVWLVGALAGGVAGWVLFAVSDRGNHRPAGTILALLAVAAVVVGGWLLRSPGPITRIASLGLSALWLVGAVVVYPMLTFAPNLLWAVGIPGAVALVTALLAALTRLPGGGGTTPAPGRRGDRSARGWGRT